MLAIIIKPFVALVTLGLICLPIRLAFQKWFPSGHIKRLLLTKIGRD